MAISFLDVAEWAVDDFTAITLTISNAGGSTPNVFEIFNGAELTSHFNEYGEVRGRPSSDSRVAARWFGHSLTQSANILEIMDRKATPREVVMSVGPDGTITAPNVTNGVVTYDDSTTPVTAGAPAGTLFVGYDADG